MVVTRVNFRGGAYLVHLKIRDPNMKERMNDEHCVKLFQTATISVRNLQISTCIVYTTPLISPGYGAAYVIDHVTTASLNVSVMHVLFY